VADRRGPFLTDRELEAALRDVGAHIAYPPSTDLVPAVRARIEAQRSGGLRQLLRSPRYAFAPALATLALLALATLAFTPLGAQAAEALGLRGILIFRTAETPAPATPRPSPSASASVPPAGVMSGAAKVASVDAASQQVGFTVIVPSALGTPDEVYTGTTRAGDPQVFLVYQPRPASATLPAIPQSAQTGIGVLVTEVRGTFDVAILGKVLGPGTKVEQLTVNGAPGVWIEGAPHDFFYRQLNGNFVQDTLRLAGNVLVWNDGAILLRIEAEIPKDAALRIASTMR
jgi:hypothetical protein